MIDFSFNDNLKTKMDEKHFDQITLNITIEMNTRVYMKYMKISLINLKIII